MKTSDFDYSLPEDLIAQEPLPERAQSRMLVLNRADGSIEHSRIGDLSKYLRANDLLVVNDTRVIPARLLGHRKDTGGRVEVLLIEEAPGPSHPGGSQAPAHAQVSGRYLASWECLYHASGRARPGQCLILADGAIEATILALGEGGRIFLEMTTSEPFMSVLERKGIIPVPPYVHRDGDLAAKANLDRTRYQTIYARNPGAVAAPTAGLHFSEELFRDLERRGIRRASVTLHVGLGTFRPVKVDRVQDHVMDSERYVIGENTLAAIQDARDSGGRVIAVGTTTVRTLETAVRERGFLVSGAGRSSLFIYPPYRFRVVDALLTNFHLPRSTLLMMVSAFVADGPAPIMESGDGKANPLQTESAEARGMSMVRSAYSAAIAERYRFYSYGDCMLIA